MKVYSSKITELWDTRGIFFDKLWILLKNTIVCLVLLGLIMSIFMDGNGNLQRMFLDIAALVIIIKTREEVDILAKKIKGIPLVSNAISPFEQLSKNRERDALNLKYERILKRYERG